MTHTKKHQLMAVPVVAALWLTGPMARADVVTDWNIKAGEFVVEARLGPSPANRVLAIVQTAVYEAVNAITQRYPASGLTQEAASGATDDALIAVLDAKYHYNFWRPITAIRNGDIDGNDATERDPSWTPFIDTPMHPEYPCAHCIVSATVGTVLHAEIGTGPLPTLTTTSYTAQGAARSWTTIEDFMQEVAQARIYDGVHYRTSTAVGTAMGKQIGELAVAKYIRPHQ